MKTLFIAFVAAICIGLTSGCDRFYGPAVYNRTSQTVSVEYVINGKTRKLAIDAGENFSERYPPSGEMSSLVAVYADQRRFVMTEEELRPVLEAAGGSKYALIVVEDRGIRVVGGKEATKILQSE